MEIPTWIFLHWEYRGLHEVWTVGIWLWWKRDEGKGGLTITRTQILAKLVHTFSTQVVILISSFTHLQNQVEANPDQGPQQGVDLPDSNAQMRSFTGHRSQLAHVQVRSWTAAPPAVKSVFHARLNWRAGDNYWKLCSPEELELRGGQAEIITSQSKTSTGKVPC